MNHNVSGYDPNTELPITNHPVKIIKSIPVKILTIIGAVVVGFIILGTVIFSVVSTNSNKLICKSSEGNITIMYNNSTITGYTATQISYNMDQQKTVASRIGIDNYISQFTAWFEQNTTGTCSVKEK